MDDLFNGRIKLEVPVKKEQVEVDEDGEDEIEEDTICPYCGSEFSVTSSLKKHISLKHKKPSQDSVSTIQCQECSQVFSSKAALYTHMSRKHPEVIEEKKVSRKTKEQGPFPCDSCDHVCKSKPDLTKHKKGVHGETGGSEVSCDDCGKLLCDKATLA